MQSMSFNIIKVQSQEVLSVEVKPYGRAGVEFLNWSVRAKSINDRNSCANFSGAGLYALCFDNKLIYIGSYLGAGKGGAFATGDVVASRWWAHIASIVSRGNRLHIARASLSALMKNPGSAHPMVAGFENANDLQALHRDQGNLSTLRRLRFALEHSTEFIDEQVSPENLLKRFTFTYVRFNEKPPTLSPLAWKHRIEAAERRLINQVAPICNSKHVPYGKLSEKISCTKVANLLKTALSQQNL